ncbi:hypothetical protein M0805_007077 [Coniferiporia weirii]|nr:hypothetical protein M0805_007077 [Coniferiporia weirii]
MDSRQLIDAQFDRAVQIVQGLPKTGPIQTGYEEKLAMYSLYKQATVGNVKGARPALWDMLGRAKWDAWAKHKDLDPYEAKWLYVDELLRVLRRYSDKTVAKDLVKELEAYGGDPANIMLSGSFSKSHESDSDHDSDRDSDGPSPSQKRLSQSLQRQQQRQQRENQGSDDEAGQSEEEEDQVGPELRGQAIAQNPNMNQSLLGRPQSSLSTQRYRTPIGSLIMSPPPVPIPPAPAYSTHSSEHLRQPSQQQLFSQQMQHPSSVYVQPLSVQHAYGSPNIPPGASVNVPNAQPMPNFETPSAFPGPSPPVSSSSMLPPTSGTSAITNLTGSGASAFTNIVHPYPANMYPGHPAYRASSSQESNGQSPGQMTGLLDSRVSGPRSPLERAIENVQAHLTALQERMDMVEARVLGTTPYASRSSLVAGGVQRVSPLGSPYTSYFGAGSGRGSGKDGSLWTWLAGIDEEYFGWEHMGLWSVALAPLARLTKLLARVLAFLLARRDAENGGRGRLSPGLVVLRRLLLDASFVLFVLFLGRKVWRRSGIRRKEVMHALAGVWGAIVGRGPGVPRQFVDRGV